MSLTGSKVSRRGFLRGGALGIGLCAAAPALAQDGVLETLAKAVTPGFGLNAADENGVMLRDGFTSRVIARSGQPIEGTSCIWHSAPAGGAVFPLSDDGWVYVSNSDAPGTGGASAIRFDSTGAITGAHKVLEGTQWNREGGTTPWGSWLSCEDHPFGRVFYCDPLGKNPAQALTGPGVLRHGGIITDPETLAVYLFERQIDGLFYRLSATDLLANGAPDLNGGVLEAALAQDNGTVEWRPVPRPLMGEYDPLRKQVPGATTFNRAQGAVIENGVIYFVTAGDGKIMAYDARANTLGEFYDLRNSSGAIGAPSGSIASAPNGGFVVGEAGGSAGLVMITAEGSAVPILRLPGHGSSEILGAAFAPDGKRLYFASRVGADGVDESGLVFEISGNFIGL